MPTIGICTPWWNHPELADDYLAAVTVRSQTDELIVVDNASDPPIEFAAIRLERNAGFSGGSNTGLNAATTDIVLFLNNDVAATRTDWLERIRANVQPGVLVGACLRHDPHGSVDGYPLPYLDGWCIAGIRGDLLELGGFDESFDEPAYYSDNDLCLRARAHGMELREVPVGLVHKVNGTVGPAWQPHVVAAFNANQRRFMDRARGVAAA